MPRPRRAAGFAPAGVEWRALPVAARALIIRNRIDEHLVAIEQQHERIVDLTCAVHAEILLKLADTAALSRGNKDISFLLTSVRRLALVAKLVRKSALPGAGALREPMRLFESRVRAALSVRDVLEHLDEAVPRRTYCWPLPVTCTTPCAHSSTLSHAATCIGVRP